MFVHTKEEEEEVETEELIGEEEEGELQQASTRLLLNVIVVANWAIFSMSVPLGIRRKPTTLS